MTTDQIRTKFLDFFKSKGHTVVASDSLVPKDDPTVLFTTAGMQQFKPQFLGRNLTYTRAATCQKCLRTDDLDVVGKTDFHHTFFEMLGNFSFGDYFKKDAIHWAWEFLTKEMKLPKEKLWVSVYQEDAEAYDIWFKEVKVPVNRIIKLGDKTNFWPSEAKEKGPNGPCGPCSEIFYDYGVNPNCSKGKDCDPECSCGRFSEVWNLVFTQFNRREGGILDPLPSKNIDTGMGLERLAAVVQGKKSNYETDIFAPVLKEIKAKVKGIPEQDARIIADHMRAVVFGISDGVVPSNEGRGYVVRKLIVDMTDLAVRGGAQKPIIHTFVDIVVERMGQPYPELSGKANEIRILVQRIEDAFIKVRKEKLPALRKEFRDWMGLAFASVEERIEKLGQIIFLYRDTYGLTLTTILKEAKNSEFELNDRDLSDAVKIYEAKMEKQKSRSRAGSKMTGDVFADTGLKLDVPKTEFLGYSVLETKATVLQVLGEGSRVKVILDRTPFYAESGGQVGDTGVLRSSDAIVKIIDTHKMNDVHIHEGILEQGALKEGDQVMAQVDSPRRQAIMRNHTATHLLQAALREVLGTHIKQQGSLVATDRLRFDFAHPGAVKPQEIQKIENRINRFIQNADQVMTEVLPLEEAKQKGALAFFAEKYGDVVRVISIGDYSREFCGGTHLSSTAQVESIKITGEGSVAQGVRRVEAVTGKAAVEEFLAQQRVRDNAQEQSERARQLERKRQNERFETVKLSVDDIIRGAQKVHGASVVTYCLQDADIGSLRKLSDLLKQKLSSGVFILGARTDKDASLIVTVTDDLVQKGIRANDIVGRVAPLFGGTGGGRPQMAQAGSKEPQQLEAALARAKDMVIL
ncbi:MAG: alanine--tRNA ligase [Candidatus Omnitrophota bacterium]|nr:alanine--tRNA ligase [Candidatus Omnitrophota bacterium]